MNSDLEIYWPKKKKKLVLKLLDEKLESHGQHGKATFLVDEMDNKYILKIFPNIIDVTNKEIFQLDVDIESEPEKMKDRLHLWRTINEYVASKIAKKLSLNVPDTIIICSSQISKHKLANQKLPLGKDVIVLNKDDDSYDTVEEVYKFSKRENYSLESSKKFEEFLGSFSETSDPTIILGTLHKFIPNSKSLDQYFGLSRDDFDKAFDNIRDLDNAYKLLPFDVWLNDPDRNQGNYLVVFTNNKKEAKPKDIFGLDYEMWSFGDDLWMDNDEIARGRSYLTAVIHNQTNIFDSRILETIYRITNLTTNELRKFSFAPRILCQFLEFHIEKENIVADERIKLIQIEQNIFDFLFETHPKMDKLTRRILMQIGLPKELKDLEISLLNNSEIDIEEEILD